MNHRPFAALLMGLVLPGSAADSGIVNIPSKHSVDDFASRS